MQGDGNALIAEATGIVPEYADADLVIDILQIIK